LEVGLKWIVEYQFQNYATSAEACVLGDDGFRQHLVPGIEKVGRMIRKPSEIKMIFDTGG
jgi:hypothetical protein